MLNLVTAVERPTMRESQWPAKIAPPSTRIATTVSLKDTFVLSARKEQTAQPDQMLSQKRKGLTAHHLHQPRSRIFVWPRTKRREHDANLHHTTSHVMEE